jgi:hypothetical protein
MSLRMLPNEHLQLPGSPGTIIEGAGRRCGRLARN